MVQLLVNSLSKFFKIPFVDKNTRKFTAWLKLDSISDLSWKQDAIEVMGLLIHEIIREVSKK